MIWDLAGDDDYQRLQTSYLRGTSGYLLVADGIRQITLDLAIEISGSGDGSDRACPISSGFK